MSEISKLRRSRTSKRNVISKSILPEIEELLHNQEKSLEEIQVELITRMEFLTESVPVFKGWDEQIADLIVEDAEYEKDEMDTIMFNLKVSAAINKVEAFLKKHREKEWKPPVGFGALGMNSVTNTSTRVSGSMGVKLPELKIKPFDGDISEWKSFIDTFEAAVGRKDNLTHIEKFAYLRGYLVGSALQCIEGFPLSHENYAEALNLLKERYGNPQVIISTHMNKLINLDKIISCDVVQLRRLYDQIENNVRALRTVGISAEHFGPLLILILLEKLPNVIRLQISRKLGKTNWDIEQFMLCINEEISARENFQYLRKKSDGEESKDELYTASSLAVASNVSRKNCIFCEKNHYSDRCSIVTEIDARRDILRKKRRCYRCLGSFHMSKSCRVRVKCYKCKVMGDHHTALCRGLVNNVNRMDTERNTHVPTPGGEEIQIACLLGSSKSVLLQTALCNVSGNNKHVLTVKALFDSCSQQTYIADRLVKILNLKPIREINMVVRTFGSEAKTMDVKEYEINVRFKNGAVFPMKAVAVPQICEKLRSQVVNRAINLHPFIQKLALADDGKNPDVHIEVLFGADVYWKLVSGEIRRDNESGLIAINSKFGWLLNGPVPAGDVSCNIISADFTTMRIETYVTEEKQLANEVNKFWDMDTVGIRDDEASVLENFMDKISFIDGRYQVELPFKIGCPVIPDNYDLSLKRLKSQKVRLQKDPKLLKAYDEIFQEQLKLGILEEVNEPGEMGNVTYLPHQAVIREHKSSTKLRIVFDPSAKISDQVSLNNVLYKGPCLTPLLYDVLLRFRAHPVAMIADVEKAYLQINVAEKHRDFFRCIWYKDPFAEDSEIRKLRFCRVIFGAAPFET